MGRQTTTNGTIVLPTKGSVALQLSRRNVSTRITNGRYKTDFIALVCLHAALGAQFTETRPQEPFFGRDLASFVEPICVNLAECLNVRRARYVTVTYGHMISQHKLGRTLGQRLLTGDADPDLADNGKSQKIRVLGTESGAHSAAHICPSINRRPLHVALGHRWLESHACWASLAPCGRVSGPLTPKTRTDLWQGVKGPYGPSWKESSQHRSMAPKYFN